MPERVDALVARFDGAIKYIPMLQDHPEWSDDECVAFAKKWHEIAIAKLRRGDERWNNGIPYCRNLPDKVMRWL